MEDALADEQLKRRLARGPGAGHNQSNISRHFEIPKHDPPDGAPRETKRSNTNLGRPESNQSTANLRTLLPSLNLCASPFMARTDADASIQVFPYATTDPRVCLQAHFQSPPNV